MHEMSRPVVTISRYSGEAYDYARDGAFIGEVICILDLPGCAVSPGAIACLKRKGFDVRGSRFLSAGGVMLLNIERGMLR